MNKKYIFKAMKKILFLLMAISCYYFSVAQKWQDPLLYGEMKNGVGAKRTLLLPSGCGDPATYNSIDSAKKMAGLYFDSCNHRLWTYDPKTTAWDSVHVGISGGGSADGIGLLHVVAGYGLNNVNDSTVKVDTSLISTKAYALSLYDILNTVKLNKSDTASMLSPYVKDALYGLTKVSQGLKLDSATVFPQIRATISTPGIDAVLAVNQHLTANRKIYTDGYEIYHQDATNTNYYGMQIGNDGYMENYIQSTSGQYSITQSQTPGHWIVGTTGVTGHSTTGNAFFWLKSNSGDHQIIAGSNIDDVDFNWRMQNDGTAEGSYFRWNRTSPHTQNQLVAEDSKFYFRSKTPTQNTLRGMFVDSVGRFGIDAPTASSSTSYKLLIRNSADSIVYQSNYSLSDLLFKSDSVTGYATQYDLTQLTTPTLQQVTTAGNTTTNTIESSVQFSMKPSYTSDKVAALSYTGNGVSAEGALNLREWSTGAGSFVTLSPATDIGASDITLRLYGNDGDTLATRAYARSVGGGGGGTSGIDDVLALSQNLTADREINVDGNNLTVKGSGTNRYIFIDPTNTDYRFGNDKSGAGTYLSIDEASKKSRIIHDGQRFFEINLTDSVYALGDLDNANHGTQMYIDDKYQVIGMGKRLQLYDYGDGNYTSGTPTYNLAVDASGYVIATSTPVGGGGTSGIDDVLAINQPLSATRIIDASGNTFKIKNTNLFDISSGTLGSGQEFHIKSYGTNSGVMYAQKSTGYVDIDVLANSGDGNSVSTIHASGTNIGTNYIFSDTAFRIQNYYGASGYVKFYLDSLEEDNSPGTPLYYNRSTKKVTFGTATGGGGGIDREQSEDYTGAMFATDNGDIDFTYNDATPDIAASIKNLAVTNAKINDVAWSKITSVPDAVADGSTKGVASFTANDFNSSSGNISIDYTNGQAASGSNKGFLTSADWTTFNNKVSFTYSRNMITSTVTGTDANITAAAGTAYHLPAATLSTGRTINVSGLNTDGDYVEFYNNEEGFVWSFTGATVYDSDGATAITELLLNTNSVIRRINGKLMISKL